MDRDALLTQIVRDALADVEVPDDPCVYQAQGMVAVQADCSLECALVRMRVRARLYEQPLEELASAVVERRIRFGILQPA